jgi:hypothetical protein
VGKKQDPSSSGTWSGPGVHGVDLTPHPMVARILNDSGEPREAVVVVGFLGAPDQNGLVRIYLDLSFQAYLEMPEGSVLYVEPFDPSDETQPTKIVVDLDGPLKLVQAVEASFLKGSIVSAHSITSPVTTGVLGIAPSLFRGQSEPTCKSPTPTPPSGIQSLSWDDTTPQ